MTNFFAQNFKKLYFNGTHMIQNFSNDEKSNQIWFFGHKMANNEQAHIYYSSMLWFSYSSYRLQDKNNKNNSSVTSDVGWGCMLRVAQMMLAYVLRRQKGFQHFDDISYLNFLITAFTQSTYSLQNMTRKGEQFFQKPAIRWYNPGEVAYILQALHNETEHPMKIVVEQQEFCLGKMYDKLKMTTGDGSKKIRPALIIQLVRIGVQQAQEELLAVIIELIKGYSNFVGILGGKKGRAHYIFGCTDKSFIYLDPHCVRENTLQNCFASKMFSMPYAKLDPSLGLCFFVREYFDLVMLHDNLNKISFIPFTLKQNYQEDITSLGFSQCILPLQTKKI